MKENNKKRTKLEKKKQGEYPIVIDKIKDHGLYLYA